MIELKLIGTIIISLITGVFSGLISGVIISSHFSKREEKEICKNLFYHQIGNIENYLYQLECEIDLIKNKKDDTNNLKRILNIPPPIIDPVLEILQSRRYTKSLFIIEIK